MTAFLFIPSSSGAIGQNRVNFGNIAALFTEADEPPAVGGMSLPSRMIRIAAFAAIVLALLGDTVIVARPGMLSHAFAMTRTTTTPTS